MKVTRTIINIILVFILFHFIGRFGDSFLALIRETILVFFFGQSLADSIIAGSY